MRTTGRIFGSPAQLFGKTAGMGAVLEPSQLRHVQTPAARSGWDFDAQYGDDELHLKASGPGAAGGSRAEKGLAMAHRLWSLYLWHPVFRVVLDLTDMDCLSPQICLELRLLNRWIGKNGGVLRLFGLSAEQLASSRLYRWFDYYPDRHAALSDEWPVRRRVGAP